VIFARAIQIGVVALALVVTGAVAVAGSHGKAKANPKELFGPWPPDAPYGYDPATGLPLINPPGVKADPGAVEDTSAIHIGIPVMAAGPAVLALSTALGLGSEAGGGLTIIGTPSTAVQNALGFVPRSVTGVLNFSKSVPPSMIQAQTLFILQTAMNRITRIYNADELPPGVTPQMLEAAYQELWQTFRDLLPIPSNFWGQTSTDPQGNVVAIGPASVDLTSSNIVAATAVDGGGAADSGGAAGSGD